MTESGLPTNESTALTKIGSRIDLTKFTPEENNKILTVKNELDLTNPNSVIAFGSEIQSNIAKFSENMLQGVKTKDVGHVGDNLISLMSTIKGIDLEHLQEKESFVSKIPIIGSIVKSISKQSIKLENVTDIVDKIVLSLDQARGGLIRDINLLESLYEKNIEYIRQLEVYIAAGELKYKELSETTLVDLKNKATETKDMLDAQKYNDFNQTLTEVEKRIYDLKLSREIAVQTMPQIRIIQGNDKVLANKIQSSILTTIPIWKNQIALTVSLQRQKEAMELQRQVSDTTEDMLRKNAELLKTNSIEIARESERGVISIETLKETHKKLIETIDESMKIYQEGKVKRQNINQELAALEKEQKNKLLAISNDNNHN